MTTYCFNQLFNHDILHVCLIQWLLLFAYKKSYYYDYITDFKYIEEYMRETYIYLLTWLLTKRI